MGFSQNLVLGLIQTFMAVDSCEDTSFHTQFSVSRSESLDQSLLRSNHFVSEHQQLMAAIILHNYYRELKFSKLDATAASGNGNDKCIHDLTSYSHSFSGPSQEQN